MLIHERLLQINGLMGEEFFVPHTYYWSIQYPGLHCDPDNHIFIETDITGDKDRLDSYITQSMFAASHLAPKDDYLFGKIDEYLRMEKHVNEESTIMVVDRTTEESINERYYFYRKDKKSEWERKGSLDKDISDFVASIPLPKSKPIDQIKVHISKVSAIQKPFYYNKLYRTIACASYSRPDGIAAIDILKKEKEHVILDVKQFDGLTGKGSRIIYDVTISEDRQELVINERVVEEDWWGSNMPEKFTPWVNVATPYNIPMHDILSECIYKGRHLWLCDGKLSFVELDGKWIPVDFSSLGYPEMGIYPVEVYEEYSVYQKLIE